MTIEAVGATVSVSSALFLHGEEGLRHDLEFLNGLSEDMSVIAPYHPGFAGSDRTALPDNIGELTSIYSRLLRDMVRDLHGPVVLMGAGFGAWLALELAARCSSRVRALGLISPLGIRIGEPCDRDIVDVFNLDLDELRRLWFVGAADDFLDPEHMTEGDWLSFAQDREGLARYVWDPYMHNPLLRNELSEVDVPTLCIWNSEDSAVSVGYYQAVANLLPESRSVVLRGSGHFPLRTQREECASLLLGFSRDSDGTEALTPRRERA